MEDGRWKMEDGRRSEGRKGDEREKGIKYCWRGKDVLWPIVGLLMVVTITDGIFRFRFLFRFCFRMDLWRQEVPVPTFYLCLWSRVWMILGNGASPVPFVSTISISSAGMNG